MLLINSQPAVFVCTLRFLWSHSNSTLVSLYGISLQREAAETLAKLMEEDQPLKEAIGRIMPKEKEWGLSADSRFQRLSWDIHVPFNLQKGNSVISSISR